MTSPALLEEHRPALTGHCYRMLGSIVDAEDAVQEADATATAMLVGENAYFILLTKEKFASFSKLPLADHFKEESG